MFHPRVGQKWLCCLHFAIFYWGGAVRYSVPFSAPTIHFSVSPSEETDAQIQVTRVGLAPKVASNFVTKNDCFGAIAAVAETQENFRFVPLKRHSGKGRDRARYPCERLSNTIGF
jgi:hypothetical protein